MQQSRAEDDEIVLPGALVTTRHARALCKDVPARRVLVEWAALATASREKRKLTMTNRRAWTMKLPALLAAIAGSLAGACAPTPVPAFKCPEATAAPLAPRSKGAAQDAASAPDKQIEVTLTPDPDKGQVKVDVIARGDAEALKTWSIAAPEAGTVHLATVRDDAGPIQVSPVATPRGPLSIQLTRAPKGAVHVSYAVDFKIRPDSKVPAVTVTPDQMEASGEAMLALPDAFDQRSLTVSIRIAFERLGIPALRLGAASSFGMGGLQQVVVRGAELRRATFIAGPIGTALFDTPEGHDEAAWFGYTSFDPRPIAADVAAFGTAAREFFRMPSTTPQALLIVSDGRPSGFVAARRARSVLVHVAASDTWSAALRIAVSAAVLHQWIGGHLWIGPDDAAQEAQAYWFTEGVTRHLARELLFRFGLITPAELIEEIHGLTGVLATNPHRGQGNVSLAASIDEPAALPLLVARGSLYAARVHALLRSKTGGKRSLDDVLRELFDSALRSRGSLPAQAWVAALTPDLGADAAAEYAKIIDKGEPFDLPDDALGPCFKSTRRRYAAFDLGFDEQATRAAHPRAVAGLRAGGPAERAGVRPGDIVVNTQYTRGRTDMPVKLSIERAGQKKTLEYLPAGTVATAQGWVRKKEVPDEACVK